MDSFDKKYYKIREVAEIIGLTASTLRFWEKQFSIIKPHRNEHGTRFYTASDIESIRMIHYLVKEKGYKLDAAQEEIRRNRQGISRQHQAITRLRDIRVRLVALQQALSRRPD